MAMSGHPPVLRQRSARVSDTNLTGPNLGGYPPASRWRTADATDTDTSALKAGRLPARVPPASRQRPLTMWTGTLWDRQLAIGDIDPISTVLTLTGVPNPTVRRRVGNVNKQHGDCERG